ncbi:hypothetical protein [Hyphococcus luteus]|uniref:Uncharacterized protein n=1 Tax=Hyphococcus luteus TaxID=2058213 RepID=A0A2S7JZ90_9PROT|nr:hypothetical protein [Marinicaulis flavus]PQA85526.1 hypothetical protein CW354_21540 [Marinicaulis flavus]
MSRPRLPDAVPPDNQTKSFGPSSLPGAGGEEEFKAPDTATPDFAIPNSNAGPEAQNDAPSFARPPEPAPSFAKVIIETDDEEDEEEEEEDHLMGGHQHPSYRLLIVIGVLLIALAAFVASRNQGPDLPDCASQPEWNQYNCRKS